MAVTVGDSFITIMVLTCNISTCFWTWNVYTHVACSDDIVFNPSSLWDLPCVGTSENTQYEQYLSKTMLRLDTCLKSNLFSFSFGGDYITGTMNLNSISLCLSQNQCSWKLERLGFVISILLQFFLQFSILGSFCVLKEDAFSQVFFGSD